MSARSRPARSSPSDRSRFVRRFLIIFLPVVAGAAAVSLILSRVDQKATVDAFAAQQSGRLALAREILGAQLRRVSSDAAYLSRLDSRNNAPAAALADPAGELARHLAVFIESHEVYDQLRVLSADGREILRVNAQGGRSTLIAPEALQDKSDQVFVITCRALAPGSLYLSRIDLDVEQGAIEQPEKPVLRACVPIAGHDGRVAHLLVLNYLARPLFDRIRSREESFPDRIWIANQDGFWMLGPTRDLEWGAQRGARFGSRLRDRDPELATAVSSAKTGRVRTENGLFAFETFDLVEVLSATPLGALAMPTVAAERWTLISYVPADAVAAPTRRMARIATGVWSVLLLLAAAAAAQSARGTVVRARVERERARELGYFQRVADALPIPVYVRGTDGRYIGANRAGAELAGKRPEEIRGKKPTDLFSLEDLGPLIAADRASNAGEVNQSFEIRLATTDGLRDLVVHRALLPAATGGFAGTVSSVMDVTELKRIQRQLAESEERFRGLVENSLDIIATLDRDGVFAYVSPSIETMLGWRFDEVIGRRLFDFVHPEDLRRLSEGFSDALRRPGASPRFQFRIRTRAGGFRHLEAVTNNQMDETLVKASYLFARDVTEAVEAQQRVEEARRIFEAVVEEMPVMFIALDEKLSPVVWNRECERVTGYSRAEIFADPRLIHALYASAGRRDQVMARFRNQMGDFRDWEVEMVRKDGELVHAAWSSVSSRVPIAGWSTWSIGIDISGRRIAEQERAKATQALESWTERLMTLNQMDDVLLACSSLDEAYVATLPFLRMLFPTESGALYRFDAGREEAVQVIAWGGFTEEERHLTARDCWAVRLVRAHRSGGAATELRCGHVDSAFTGSTLCVPVLAGGELQGVLHVRSSGKEKVPVDLDSLRQIGMSIAGHLSIRFSALGLRDLLQYQSTRDPLTNLFNRRYLAETLERELQRCLRAKKSLAVLALDLDHFKRVNDEHGHDAGDRVLKALAALLSRHSRAADIACRAGGEEFLVVLPEASLTLASDRAEEVRRAVESLRESEADPEFSQLTVSIGVAVYPDHGSSGAELLHNADRALYRAKEGGRNRVELAAKAGPPESS